MGLWMGTGVKVKVLRMLLSDKYRCNRVELYVD